MDIRREYNKCFDNKTKNQGMPARIDVESKIQSTFVRSRETEDEQVREIFQPIITILKIAGLLFDNTDITSGKRRWHFLSVLHLSYCLIMLVFLSYDSLRVFNAYTAYKNISYELMGACAVSANNIFLVYVQMTNFYSMTRYMCSVKESFSEYGNKYGWSINSSKVRKGECIVAILYTIINISIFFSYVFVLICSLDEETVLLYTSLTPFENVDRTYRVTVIVLACLAKVFAYWSEVSILLFYTICVYCIVKEYSVVRCQLEEIMTTNNKRNVLENEDIHQDQSLTTKIETFSNKEYHDIRNRTETSVQNIRKVENPGQCLLKIEHLRQKHEGITQILSSSNRILQNVAFAAFAGGVSVICFLLYGIINGSLKTEDVFASYTQIFVVVFLLIYILLTGAIVSSIAHGPLDLIYQIDLDGIPDNVLHKIHMFANRLSGPTIGISVYGLFTIDKSSILMLFGTVLTYAVVILQLPRSGDTSNCLNSTLTT